MDAKKISERISELLYEGKIRNNKIKNKAREHDGELLKAETQLFFNFLTSRNSNIVNMLRGNDNSGEY